jgi:hypothetical protein
MVCIILLYLLCRGVDTYHFFFIIADDTTPGNEKSISNIDLVDIRYVCSTSTRNLALNTAGEVFSWELPNDDVQKIDAQLFSDGCACAVLGDPTEDALLYHVIQ